MFDITGYFRATAARRRADKLFQKATRTESRNLFQWLLTVFTSWRLNRRG